MKLAEIALALLGVAVVSQEGHMQKKHFMVLPEQLFMPEQRDFEPFRLYRYVITPFQPALTLPEDQTFRNKVCSADVLPYL